MAPNLCRDTARISPYFSSVRAWPRPAYAQVEAGQMDGDIEKANEEFFTATA